VYTEAEYPSIPVTTISPAVPREIRFGGEMIDLRRYNMYEGMDRELKCFVYNHSSTLLLLKRAGRYFPVIEQVLKANGIPEDFKYLAVVESRLDPLATSPMKAVGLWQFIESTARENRLTIAPTVDERYNVRLSTEAACRYLRRAYDSCGNWVTVALTYNAGISRIKSATTAQLTVSPLDLWLNEETARYAYRIFAAKEIFENPRRYGFKVGAQDMYKRIKCEERLVTADIPDLARYAKSNGITLADLKRFNPWLRDSHLRVNGKKFVILIPQVEDMYY
jgi:hypothetical protein